MKKPLLKLLVPFSLAISLLTATASCAVLTPSKPFTVQGELPANTGITFLSNYYPEDDTSSACHYRDIASGSSELRDGSIGSDIPIKATPQHYQVAIPTQTYMGRCKVLLTGVSVVVANEDNNDRQTDQTGFIGVVDKTPLLATKEHPAHFNMSCDWSFSISPIKSRPNDDIRKFMSCTVEKNQYVSRNVSLSDLSNQSMMLNISFNKPAQPSCKDCWIKIKTGWKPCKGPYNLEGECGAQPEFIKFKYQGKTCSVYPTCTE